MIGRNEEQRDVDQGVHCRDNRLDGQRGRSPLCLDPTSSRSSARFARQTAGSDLGETLGLPANGVLIHRSLDEVLARGAKPDVLVDYTDPTSVKSRTFDALANGIRVVIGTSGLTAADYAEIEREAVARGLGVVAAGNFSITATLAKHFSLLAAVSAAVDGRSSTTRVLRRSMHPAAP